MKREGILARLGAGLWHTTSPERYLQILRSGAILPEPNIRDEDRWGTLNGPAGYPLVRKIGGISLFDFRNFDPVEYGITHPMSNWQEFVPFRKIWSGAVWIHLPDFPDDYELFKSADALVNIWDKKGCRHRNILPRIEAAHLGAVSVSIFKDVFLVDEVDTIALDGMGISEVEAVLAAWYKKKRCP